MCKFRFIRRFIIFSHDSKNSILNAPYVGFINLDAPTFGDIAVLAKGKLKKNANKTFSFEQINDRCDEKCQLDANTYLENVTALWMVERIRHRDDTSQSHRYDLKFTIVPIHDPQHQIDHNILESRLKNHMKRTFILRDYDYPYFFQPYSNRRTDIFSPNIERSISNFMNTDPNSLMQNFLGLGQTQKQRKKDSRLNTGEFYMSPKIQTSGNRHTKNVHDAGKLNFHPTINGHAAHQIDHHVRFPDSREMIINKPPPNLYRPRPEIYNQKNFIHYRGANDNVYVGSSDSQQMHPNQLGPVAVPVFSIPVDMPIIQIAQTAYGAFPIQIQLSTPPNTALFQQQQHDVTTYRYPQLISLSNQAPQQLFNPYVTPIVNLAQNRNSSKQFHESERHTMNFYSPIDPVYHHHQQSQQQSTTEVPIQPSTYSPRFNNYAHLRPQINTPAQSTAGSNVRVNTFDDNGFQPVTPSYDVRKHHNFKNFVKSSSTTAKPDSINAQLYDVNDPNENITIPYVTSSPTVISSVKVNEVNNYQIVVGRPKYSSTKLFEASTEKPVLKWIPKKQRNTSTTPPPPISAFVPTILPTEKSSPISTTTVQPSTRLTTTHIFRGRNRFNKRNSSSSNGRAATISPQTTRITRKKTTSAIPFSASSTPAPIVTVFPTYITPAQSTDDPITSQSFSTSISLEVNGERVDTTIGYELVSAGVESVDTNNTNVKLFKASVVPEKFDDLTFSILNHAQALQNDENE